MPESWSGVIEVVKDPFGVAALVVLALFVLAVIFFRPDSTKVRMAAFIVLVVLFAGFVFLAFLDGKRLPVEPSTSGRAEGDLKTTPEQVESTLAWDRRHGVLLGDLHRDLRAAGFQVEIVHEVLVPEVLSGFDALVIATDGVSEKGLEQAELVTVERWVRRGNLLILADQAWHWVGGLGRKVEDFPLNALALRFDVLITGLNVGAPDEVSSGLDVPDGTLRRDGWWPSRVKLRGSGTSLVRDRNGNSILVETEAGEGLVIVAGSGGLLRDNPRFTSELLMSRLAMIKAPNQSTAPGG